jgi:hypothetical protein
VHQFLGERQLSHRIVTGTRRCGAYFRKC